MKPLPENFLGRGTYQGFQFRQICVSEWAFCYEVKAGDQIYYHTFKKVENPRFQRISYPGPNAFGIWAWCFYKNLDSAMKKFDELNKGEGI